MHILLLALALVAQQPSDRLTWVPNPRTTSGSWVSDPAGHLRPATVATLDSIIAALERETSAEIAVVVIDSLDGMEPADAALLLHRRWGVGKSARDNGVVFLWSPALRRTQVSVGYGLEGVLIDSRVGRIMDQHVIPPFRRGDFDAGVVAGVRALADAAREERYEGPARSQALRPRVGEEENSSAGSIVGGVLGGVALLIGGTVLGVRWRRRRPRKCPRGHGRMQRIHDAQDERYFQAGQALEEKLATVDYDVWVCPRCDERLVIPYRKWFSSFEKCPACGHITCASEQKTIHSPTTTSTGLRRIRRHCQHCGFRDSRDEVIPMVSESDGSGIGGGSGGGGGGGGSFGGGSAGGGGAGRSY